MYVFKQGHLDGLCGKYSALHALGYVRDISYEEAKEFFMNLCFEAREFAPYAVYNGLTFSDLKKLVFGMNEWLPPSKKVKVSQPFKYKKFNNVADFGQELAKLINHQKRCAILSLGEPWNHWSVTEFVSPKSFRMIDSSPYHLSRLLFSSLDVKSRDGVARLHPRQTLMFSGDD